MNSNFPLQIGLFYIKVMTWDSFIKFVYICICLYVFDLYFSLHRKQLYYSIKLTIMLVFILTFSWIWFKSELRVKTSSLNLRSAPNSWIATEFSFCNTSLTRPETSASPMIFVRRLETHRLTSVALDNLESEYVFRENSTRKAY